MTQLLRYAALAALVIIAPQAVAQDSASATSARATYCTPAEYSRRGFNPASSERDEFEGFTRTKSRETTLMPAAKGLSGFLAAAVSNDKMRLQLQHFVSRAGAPSFQVFALYEGEGWFFIEEGESLLFLADGERIGLTSRNGSRADRETVYGSTVRERAMYEITPEQLSRIAAAKQVKVRLHGGRGYSDYNLEKQGSCVIARFLADFARPVTAVGAATDTLP